MESPERLAAPKSPVEVLSRHGRSFHFASQFLGSQQADRAARLYAFCRTLDDIADLGTDRQAADTGLARIQSDLATGRRHHPLVTDLLDLADTTGLSIMAAHELVAGVRADIGRVEIADVDALLRYSYRVAGTVGLMMCPILGVTDERAHPFAVDLGIAMQLTNIARDVIDDARAGRRYLPGTWMNSVSPEQIIDGASSVRQLIRSAVQRLLLLAETYYASGQTGLAFLPPRPRLAIGIAAGLYRAIGQELARRDFAPWRGRAVVSLPKKCFISARVLLAQCGRVMAGPPQLGHATMLHRCLIGFPGTDPELGWAA